MALTKRKLPDNFPYIACVLKFTDKDYKKSSIIVCKDYGG